MGRGQLLLPGSPLNVCWAGTHAASFPRAPKVMDGRAGAC